MKLFSILILLILCCQLGSGQRLKTYFLPPSAPSYETRETYFLGVTSDRKDLCVGNWLGETQPMLIPNGVDAFSKCGMHDFVDYSPTFGYDIKIGTIFANMSLYIYINPLTSPLETDCFSRGEPQSCIYYVDRVAIERLMNVTFVIPSYHYIPEWAFIIIVITTIIIIPMIIFIIYYMRRKRSKTLYLKQMEHRATQDEYGDYEKIQRFHPPRPNNQIVSDDDPFMDGVVYTPFNPNC